MVWILGGYQARCFVDKCRVLYIAHIPILGHSVSLLIIQNHLFLQATTWTTALSP